MRSGDGGDSRIEEAKKQAEKKAELEKEGKRQAQNEKEYEDANKELKKAREKREKVARDDIAEEAKKAKEHANMQAKMFQQGLADAVKGGWEKRSVLDQEQNKKEDKKKALELAKKARIERMKKMMGTEEYENKFGGSGSDVPERLTDEMKGYVDEESAALKKKKLRLQAQKLRQEWHYPQDNDEDVVPKSYAGQSYHEFQLGWKAKAGLPKAPVERCTEHGQYKYRYMEQEHGGKVVKKKIPTGQGGIKEQTFVKLDGHARAPKWERLKAPKSTLGTSESRAAYQGPRVRPQSATSSTKKLTPYAPEAKRNQLSRKFKTQQSSSICLGKSDTKWVNHVKACRKMDQQNIDKEKKERKAYQAAAMQNVQKRR